MDDEQVVIKLGRIQLRRDTAANWVSKNPILYPAEIGIELDTSKIKVGVPSKLRWNSLSYSGGPKEGVDFANIESPKTSELIPIFQAKSNMTITEIVAAVIGSSTPSLTIDPFHSLNVSGAGTNYDILDTPTEITNTTTGQSLTSFDVPAVPINSWIILKTTAKSGTVDNVIIVVKYIET